MIKEEVYHIDSIMSIHNMFVENPLRREIKQAITIVPLEDVINIVWEALKND